MAVKSGDVVGIPIEQGHVGVPDVEAGIEHYALKVCPLEVLAVQFVEHQGVLVRDGRQHFYPGATVEQTCRNGIDGEAASVQCRPRGLV